jgi:hypothetical protein
LRTIIISITYLKPNKNRLREFEGEKSLEQTQGVTVFPVSFEKEAIYIKIALWASLNSKVGHCTKQLWAGVLFIPVGGKGTQNNSQ